MRWSNPCWFDQSLIGRCSVWSVTMYKIYQNGQCGLTLAVAMVTAFLFVSWCNQAELQVWRGWTYLKTVEHIQTYPIVWLLRLATGRHRSTFSVHQRIWRWAPGHQSRIRVGVAWIRWTSEAPVNDTIKNFNCLANHWPRNQSIWHFRDIDAKQGKHSIVVFPYWLMHWSYWWSLETVFSLSEGITRLRERRALHFVFTLLSKDRSRLCKSRLTCQTRWTGPFRELPRPAKCIVPGSSCLRIHEKEACQSHLHMTDTTLRVCLGLKSQGLTARWPRWKSTAKSSMVSGRSKEMHAKYGEHAL